MTFPTSPCLCKTSLKIHLCNDHLPCSSSSKYAVELFWRVFAVLNWPLKTYGFSSWQGCTSLGYKRVCCLQANPQIKYGPKYGPVCHRLYHADVTKCFHLGAIVTALVACCWRSDVMALSHYKCQKSALTANPIAWWSKELQEWCSQCSLSLHVCVACTMLCQGLSPLTLLST